MPKNNKIDAVLCLYGKIGFTSGPYCDGTGNWAACTTFGDPDKVIPPRGFTKTVVRLNGREVGIAIHRPHLSLRAVLPVNIHYIFFK